MIRRLLRLEPWATINKGSALSSNFPSVAGSEREALELVPSFVAPRHTLSHVDDPDREVAYLLYY